MTHDKTPYYLFCMCFGGVDCQSLHCQALCEIHTLLFTTQTVCIRDVVESDVFGHLQGILCFFKSDLIWWGLTTCNVSSSCATLLKAGDWWVEALHLIVNSHFGYTYTCREISLSSGRNRTVEMVSIIPSYWHKFPIYMTVKKSAY